MSKSNLKITSTEAWSYNTCIAVFDPVNKTAIMNETKYSTTTSKHQSKVRQYIAKQGYSTKSLFGVAYEATPDTLRIEEKYTDRPFFKGMYYIDP